MVVGQSPQITERSTHQTLLEHCGGRLVADVGQFGDERCHTSGGTNLDGVSKQKSQALNQVGLAGACSACDNEPQRSGTVASEVILHSGVHHQLCSLQVVWTDTCGEHTWCCLLMMSGDKCRSLLQVGVGLSS